MKRDEWLAQIEQNPHDWQMALIAADEIESDGDELFAEQLRFAVQWSEGGVYCVSVEFLDGAAGITHKGHWQREYERDWCEQNNIRFVPAFPRSLDDVYAGRELV